MTWDAGFAIKPAALRVVPGEKALNGIPQFQSWQTSSRPLLSELVISLTCDKKINTQLN